MSKPFDYFVLLAEMRTGSNYLEANLNDFSQITCYGEAFNPYFIGYPNQPDILGVTAQMRDQDPVRLINTITSETDGIGGFRFFHDHNPRAIEHCLEDKRCAKIILSRNPVESYVSWKIAQATDQWKLTNHQKRRDAKIRFNQAEFEEVLARQRQFRSFVQSSLQQSGQTAFHISYSDLHDLEVLNGLARFLGADQKLTQLSNKIKKQNPAHLSDKVINFEEMDQSLASSDFFALAETPGFEPTRGPGVPAYRVASEVPLLFLPIRGTSVKRVTDWMHAVDGGKAPESGFTQKTLRQWKREHNGHRSFTVVCHPVARAHSVFCRHILNTDDGDYREIRETLRQKFDVPLPDGDPGQDWDIRSHRSAFLAFLKFLKSNLSGQTWVRVDMAWASQSAILQGINQFVFPDAILREDQLLSGLNALCEGFGHECPSLEEQDPDQPFVLGEFYDDEVEAAARSAYQRDYMQFGFGAWCAKKR